MGQPEATQAVASAIQLAYSGLTDPDRPVASFLLVGPTGTGKTLLAKMVIYHDISQMAVLTERNSFM